ncbi:MAG: hypothetical protein Q9160_008796 [Pyrenula sp. 1 TL-2023]
MAPVSCAFFVEMRFNVGQLRSSRTRAGLNPEYAAANTRRGAGGIIDHDPTEGLPVRKWEYRDVTFNQNPKPPEEPSAGGYVFPNENYPWSELPLPKDFTALAPHVQHVLRRARAGNTFIKKPPSTANGHATNGSNGIDGNKATTPAVDEAEVIQSSKKSLLDDDRTFCLRRWAPSTRQDLPEKTFLAPRRPGLPPLYGHNAPSGVTNGVTPDAKKKTVKVKKTDPETGASKIYDVMIIEGTEHTISGQILPAASADPITAPPQPAAELSVPPDPNQATSSVKPAAPPSGQPENMPTETLAPGTVIEGVGVANEQGVVVAPAAAAAMNTVSAGVQETNKRRPPPPPKRKKFGPGRGKKGPMKKVVFEGEGGAAIAVEKQEGVKKEGEEEGEGEGEGDDEEGEGSEEGEIDEGEEVHGGDGAAANVQATLTENQPPPAMTLDAPESNTLSATAPILSKPDSPVLSMPEPVPQPPSDLDMLNEVGTMVHDSLPLAPDEKMADVSGLSAFEAKPAALPTLDALSGVPDMPAQASMHSFPEASLPKPPAPLPNPAAAPAPGLEATIALDTGSAQESLAEDRTVSELARNPDINFPLPSSESIQIQSEAQPHLPLQAQETTSSATAYADLVDGEAPATAAVPELPPSLPPKPAFDVNASEAVPFAPAPAPPATLPDAPATPVPAPAPAPPSEMIATTAAEDADTESTDPENVANLDVVPTVPEIETGMDLKAAGEGEDEGEAMDLEEGEGEEEGAAEGEGQGEAEGEEGGVVDEQEVKVPEPEPMPEPTPVQIEAGTMEEATQVNGRGETGAEGGRGEGAAEASVGAEAEAGAGAGVGTEGEGEEMDLLGRLEQGIEDGE